MLSMLSSCWRVRLKSSKRKLMIKPEKQPRRKSHRPSKVNDAIATANFFVHIYIDYNEQAASFKEKGQEKEDCY